MEKIELLLQIHDCKNHTYNHEYIIRSSGVQY